MSASKSVSNFLVRGLFAPPVTPFTPDGNLNLAIIDPYVQHLGEFGVSNVFVTGTIGEGMLMTVAERKLVVEAWVKAAKGKLSCVMVQVGTANLKDSQELATHAQTVGADAIACVGSSYFKPDTLESYVSYMKEVAAAAPSLPFYLYDIDFVTGIKFAASDFFRVAKDVIPTLRGIKHTTNSIRNMADMLAEFGDRFQVLCGLDELYLACLAIGVETGVFSSYGGNVLNRLKAAFDKGDLETARLEQRRVDVLDKIQADIGFGMSGGTKAMLSILGLDVGQPRLPMAPVPQQKVDQLKKELTDIGFFEWGFKK
ncbi:N-acetylneuraminate lyase [Lamellibrachia satsuma]|nr:N-acetylneuraminate lyase [Lamellibrachia satsuma]